MYNRRNKMDPLWNSLVVGGVGADGTPFLGMVGMQGTHYTDSHVTTGEVQAGVLPRRSLRHMPVQLCIRDECVATS
jgi:20S proteasome subunit beta 7